MESPKPSKKTDLKSPLTSLCEICKKEPPKYKCVGCSLKLCSSDCTKLHKSITSPTKDGLKPCSKLNDPTTYKPMSKLGKREILRDFKFISDLMVKSDQTRKRLSLLGNNVQKHKEMMRFKILRNNAEKKGIEIEFAPIFMTRHRNNISFYFTKTKTFFWVFQICYVKFEKSEKKLKNEKNGKFEIFDKIVGPKSEEEKFGDMVKEYDWTRVEVLNDLGRNLDFEKLMEEEKNPNGISFLMLNEWNVEKVKTDMEMPMMVKEQILQKEKFVKISLKNPISSFVRNLKILEYPTVYVVKNENLIEFGLSFGRGVREEKEEKFDIREMDKINDPQ